MLSNAFTFKVYLQLWSLHGSKLQKAPLLSLKRKQTYVVIVGIEKPRPLIHSCRVLSPYIKPSRCICDELGLQWLILLKRCRNPCAFPVAKCGFFFASKRPDQDPTSPLATSIWLQEYPWVCASCDGIPSGTLCSDHSTLALNSRTLSDLNAVCSAERYHEYEAISIVIWSRPT